MRWGWGSASIFSPAVSQVPSLNFCGPACMLGNYGKYNQGVGRAHAKVVQNLIVWGPSQPACVLAGRSRTRPDALAWGLVCSTECWAPPFSP